MTGKVMCPCEQSDVAKGRQKKTCKECDKYEKRDIVTAIIVVIGLISFFMCRYLVMYFVPISAIIVWISILLERNHSQEGKIETNKNNDSYFTMHRQSQCAYCFKINQRNMYKSFIRSIIWSDKLADWIIKKKKE